MEGVAGWADLERPPEEKSYRKEVFSSQLKFSFKKYLCDPTEGAIFIETLAFERLKIIKTFFVILLYYLMIFIIDNAFLALQE